MVDVGEKEVSNGVARASGFIHCQGKPWRLIRENAMKKGDVLVIAEIAGVQAAKNTAGVNPPLP